ncbi:MAG: hypothetical protein POELPBGB_01860 [Bacteroidia bacterium]|nr:hypothetical protein [Bacteroidia bacterium]
MGALVRVEGFSTTLEVTAMTGWRKYFEVAQ